MTNENSPLSVVASLSLFTHLPSVAGSHPDPKERSVGSCSSLKSPVRKNRYCASLVARSLCLALALMTLPSPATAGVRPRCQNLIGNYKCYTKTPCSISPLRPNDTPIGPDEYHIEDGHGRDDTLGFPAFPGPLVKVNGLGLFPSEDLFLINGLGSFPATVTVIVSKDCKTIMFTKIFKYESDSKLDREEIWDTWYRIDK